MAMGERKTLVKCLAEIGDTRTGNGKRHNLHEVLIIAICAIFAGAEGYSDIAGWAEEREEWLKRYLRLENGIPSHDTITRIFRILDPKKFEQAFRTWISGVVGVLRETIAIDGKALRGVLAAKGSPVHMVSAFATNLGLVIGQEKVAEKSNEIIAIPKLLETLALKGCLVSIDAMGTQREIARSIRSMGADYLLAVKGNQPELHAALENAFGGPQDSIQNVTQIGHGRHVFQIFRTLPNTRQVDTKKWLDCSVLGRVDSMRVINGQASCIETRYYIASGELATASFAAAVRDHWGIENRLHWSLDVIFGEDGRHIVEGNGPQNYSLLTKIVLNLLRQDTSEPKKSLRSRLKRTGWNDDRLSKILGLEEL